MLTGNDASVRLVLTPETVVVAEARRSLTTLSLFGYRVDGVVANRVFPAGAPTSGAPAGCVPRRRCWPRSTSPSPGCRSGAPLPAAASPSVSTRSPAFAEAAYGGDDPLAARRRRADDRHPHPSRAPPCASRCRSSPKSDVDLARHGDELVVTVGSYRRLLALPAALSRHTGSARASRTGRCR